MFFADPIAAFSTIGTALRPGARLVMMVWQAPGRNEWWTTIRQALAADSTAPVPPGSGPHMFSLADPDSTEGILAASGFAEVGCTEVHEPSATAWTPPPPPTSSSASGHRGPPRQPGCRHGRAGSATATRHHRRAQHRQRRAVRLPCLDYRRSPPLACRRRPGCESAGKSRSLEMPTELARRTSERPLACRRGSRLSSCRVEPGTGCGRGREGDPECRERVGGEGVLRGVDHPEVGANVQFGSCDEQFYQWCP